MKRYFLILLLFSVTCMDVLSCSDEEVVNQVDSEDDSDNEDTNEETEDPADGDSHEESGDYDWDENLVVEITLNITSISSSSDAVDIDGTTATITQAGTYRISGELSDGQILVDTQEDEKVQLLLNGVDITHDDSSPLAILNASKTIIILEDGTTNYLADASDYMFEEDEDEPDAALFSDDDLTIYGQGTLIVDGNYNDAILAKDGLILKNTHLVITSVDDGIKGKDFMIVDNSDLEIEADGNGLISDNEDNNSVGFIEILNGTFEITAGGDAIQAESELRVQGGDFTLNAGGGSEATIGEDDSAKGMKATSLVYIEDGNFDIDVVEDGIHANESVVIDGGIIQIAAGDDAIHSDLTLEINDGEITITTSLEGIEGADIIINDGTILLSSRDDGLNAVGEEEMGDYSLTIHGGMIVIDADGDGIDSNGTVEMTGGTVIVNGPTARNNSAIDYDKSFNISGGFLLAVGSAGMAQDPSSSSDQKYAGFQLASAQDAGTLVHLETEDGEEIFTFKPPKAYQTVVFSTPTLEAGTSYELYIGGSTTGKELYGLFEGGVYTPGTLLTNFTL